MTLRFFSVFALVCCLWPSGRGYADQHDARLPALFEALLAAQNTQSAEAIELEIWAAWTAYSDPLVADLMYQAGVDMGRGAFSSAELALNQVVLAAPDYAEGWNRRATLYFYMERFEESLLDIEQVLALEPRHFGALSGRGQCLVALERFEEAAQAFQEMLRINPQADGAKESLRRLEAILGKGI